MSMETMITWAVVLIGAMMQGMTGLGFALVSVPVLILFQDPHSVIATTLILSVVLNSLILFQARGSLSLRDAGPITLGSVLGIPFGTYLLAVVSTGILKDLVAGLVLLFSIPLLLGYTRTFSHPRAVSLATGALSGVLQGSTGMGGPPVALLMASQRISKESFRGMLVVRSAASSALSVLALAAAGMIDSGLAMNALLLVPALLVGFVLGSRLLKLVPQYLFKKVAVLLVAGSAVFSLAGSIF